MYCARHFEEPRVAYLRGYVPCNEFGVEECSCKHLCKINYLCVIVASNEECKILRKRTCPNFVYASPSLEVAVSASPFVGARPTSRRGYTGCAFKQAHSVSCKSTFFRPTGRRWRGRTEHSVNTVDGYLGRVTKRSSSEPDKAVTTSSACFR